MDNERCPRCGRKLGPEMAYMLYRMDRGFVPHSKLAPNAHAPLWGVLGRLSRHGLIRGVVNEQEHRVDYVRNTPSKDDIRLWCVPKREADDE